MRKLILIFRAAIELIILSALVSISVHALDYLFATNKLPHEFYNYIIEIPLVWWVLIIGNLLGFGLAFDCIKNQSSGNVEVESHKSKPE